MTILAVDDKPINNKVIEMDIKEYLNTTSNKSHKHIHAKVFLEEHTSIDYILDDLEDIEADIENHIDILYDGNLIQEIDVVITNINQYSLFFNNFTEFTELSTALTMLADILSITNFSNINDKHMHLISEFIKAILIDLLNWKQHVFILQDAIDVYYINASLLSSCIQLETILKENKEQ